MQFQFASSIKNRSTVLLNFDTLLIKKNFKTKILLNLTHSVCKIDTNQRCIVIIPYDLISYILYLRTLKTYKNNYNYCEKSISIDILTSADHQKF